MSGDYSGDGLANNGAGGSGGGGDSTSGSWRALLESVGQKLVTVLVTAGSLVGFVAFAGSVVIWTRFFAIHVPPEQVVAAVPQGESVAVGSVMLLLFGFFGVLATLAVYLIDRGGRTTPGLSRGLLLILALEAAVAIWIVGASSVLDKVIASEVVALAFGVILWSTFVGGLIELEPGEVPNLDDEKKEQEQKLPQRAFWKRGDESGVALATVGIAVGVAAAAGFIAFWAMRHFDSSTGWCWVIALGLGETLLLAAVTVHWARFEFSKKQRKHRRKRRRKERQEEAKTGRKRKPPRFTFTALGVLVAMPLALLAVVVPSLVLHEWWVAVSFIVILVLGCGLWRIATLSRGSFLWLGLAVFISVPLFGTLMLMARNLADPQVQAVALIRSTDGPDEAIQGLYVTETNDRVYFANVATEGCSDKVKAASGRLLWVPKTEVVAMSIGPLEDVEDAGKTALEMAYALTPSVETPAGDHVRVPRSTAPSKSAAGKAKAAAKAEKAAKKSKKAPKVETKAPPAEAPEQDGRLEDPGPAVRPNFGSGLSLYPETASPGETVELRLSAPDPSLDGLEGFGPKPEGRTLRLNGVPVALAREGTRHADEAEYVKTIEGTRLSLDKQGVYRFKDGEPELLEDESEYGGAQYVKLEDRSVLAVKGGHSDDFPEYLKVDDDGSELVEGAEASLEEGKFVPLDRRFRRQAWGEDQITFIVPENGATGVVTMDCGQLAGQPLLQVSHDPTARISVRMKRGSTSVSFNGSQSSDEDGEELSSHWMIDGVRRGHRPRMATRLAVRRIPYSVELTVTDEAGHSDAAKLWLLRLPTSLFAAKNKKPLYPKRLKAARAAFVKAAAEHPVAIELDSHSDDGGAPAHNLALSLARNDHVREKLMLKQKEAPEGEDPVPVQELAYGKSCPVDPRPGERRDNKRVEVFVLEQGVTVKPPRRCTPGAYRRHLWKPPLPSIAEAALSPSD